MQGCSVQHALANLEYDVCNLQMAISPVMMFDNERVMQPLHGLLQLLTR